VSACDRVPPCGLRPVRPVPAGRYAQRCTKTFGVLLDDLEPVNMSYGTNVHKKAHGQSPPILRWAVTYVGALIPGLRGIAGTWWQRLFRWAVETALADRTHKPGGELVRPTFQRGCPMGWARVGYNPDRHEPIRKEHCGLPTRSAPFSPYLAVKATRSTYGGGEPGNRRSRTS
jgi:hypothetical protein